MLEVVEPVDESRTAIAFATEPIFASLSNLLGNYENLPSVPDDIRKFELDDLEVTGACRFQRVTSGQMESHWIIGSGTLITGSLINIPLGSKGIVAIGQRTSVLS
jgi:hypothetical protein